MTSIDATLRRLEQQLKKHKEKVTNHRNAGRRASLESESEPTTPRSASSD
jgi:ribosome-associated translation inhibitor RaiA